ncbi:armadillo-type protein [Absidia repens]|uniref:Armadillo-type protein n=1 Tax=Absidia repens TaxID=90262 RepID=A0A1X2IBK4_9FUNG|nr:armadillo-type protein [Absidia repens]
MDTQEDFLSLSITDRLQHKVWKARQSAYTELYNLFRKTVDDSDFIQYEGYLKNIATDTNAVAQENGLNTIYEYVNSAPNASRTRETIVPVLVTKCLGAPKAGTKQKATDIILLYAEIDVADPVVDLVLPGLQVKQPKLVAQTVVVLRELLRQYGAKTVNPKPLIKILPKLFGHGDKNVRAEAFTLTIEIYKWIGSALTPLLSDLKPVQMKELEEAFGNLPSERPSPERLLRSEQRKMEEAAAAEVVIGESHNDTVDGDETMDDRPMDPYDISDPVDITASLPGNFFELLGSKKWQERREALDVLLASAKTPNIMDKDYSELIGALAKRINDANILLVGVTANCIEAIATGTRASFEKYKELVVPHLVEKLKERKPAILEQLANALHAVFSYMSIMDVTESIAVAVKHKNPQIRTQSVKLIIRQLQIIHKVPTKLETKALAELMLKTLDDADGAAREASAEGLGTLMNVVGERPMLAFIDPLDDIKKNKISEYCSKAQVMAKQTMVKKSVAPSVKKAPALKKIIKTIPPVHSKPEPMVIDDESPLPISRPSAPKRKPTSTLLDTRSNKKPVLSTTKPKSSTTAKVNAEPPKNAVKLPPASGPEEVKFKYSPEDAEARVTDYIPSQIWEDVGSSQWKVRLAAMESLRTHLESTMESSNIEAEIIIRCLSKRPGWKEMNFQVMTKLYNVMQLLASNCPSFSRSCVTLGIPGIVEKLGDAKLKKPAGECLVAFSETTSLQFVLSQSYPIWKKAKSPKIVTDSLIWIHQALLDFGIGGLQVRDLIDFVKIALANTNPTVRTNAINVLGGLRMYLGPDIIAFVQDVSPALMTNIENEFEKVSKMDPPKPTKTSTALRAKASNSQTGAKNIGGDPGTDALESLIPHTDIASQLGKVSSNCGDANWKNRKEGLNQVVSIIEGANRRIKPNLGEFPGVLKQRLTDSNKILQIQALEIVGLLVLSMGKPFEKYVKFLSGNLISVLADNKATVRNAGMTTLDIIRQTCGLEGLIGAFETNLASDSPILRKELLTWLLQSINEQGISIAVVDYSPLISPILSCLQDRNGEVRKAAQAILPSVAMSTGFEMVMRKVSDLNNTQRQTVLPFVESIRGSVPTTPAKTISSISSLTAKTKRLSTSTSPARDILHSDFAATTRSGNDLDRRTSGFDRRQSLDSLGRSTVTKSRVASASPLNDNFSTAQYSQPPLLTDDFRTKQLRSKEDIRWQFDASRTDLIDILQRTCESHIQPDIYRLMFSSSHNAERDRLNALGQLDDCIVKPELSMDKYGLNYDEMKRRYQANSDLIFKYLTIRFLDTSTSMLIKCLDLSQHLIALLDSQGAILSEYEAISFIPFLINKIGDPKEIIRAKIRSILNSACTIYPPSKMVNILLDSAANSKNPKARAECLDEIGTLLQQYGISVMLPNKALPLIATHIGDRDPGVRNTALNAIAQTYIIIGDPVLKYVNRLGEKEKGLLEERLKRTIPQTTSHAEKDGIQQLQQQEVHEMDIDNLPSIKQASRLSTGSSRSQSHSSHHSNSASSRSLSRHNTVSPMDGVVHGYENTTTAYHGHGLGSEITHVSHLAHQSNHAFQQRQQSNVGHHHSKQQVDMVDHIIKQIAHGTDPQENIEALKHLVKYLNTASEMVLPEMETLVKALTLQVRVAYSMVGSPDPMTTRLCKHIVNTLVLLFSKSDLAVTVAKETLVSLLEELASRLLDERILSLESGPQLSKALNVAMVKILENCQRNRTFSALLSILGNCAVKLRPNDSSSGTETKYTELVMKCLWKLAKTIQDNLRSGLLQPDQLLFEINEFFLVTPPDEWKRRMRENVPLGELPLRTVKTLLLEIVSGLGEQVFEHLTLINDPPNSNIYPYLHHMLDACEKKGGIEHLPSGNEHRTLAKPVRNDPTTQQFTSSSIPPATNQPQSHHHQYESPQMQSTIMTAGHSHQHSKLGNQPSPSKRPSSISSSPFDQPNKSAPKSSSRLSIDRSKMETDQPSPSNMEVSSMLTRQGSSKSPGLVSQYTQQSRHSPSAQIQNHPPSSQSTTTGPLTDHDISNALKRIFEKIGTREETKEGIVELYEFQKKHPLAESKVNDYLCQTGSYFQRYIRRGLDSLASNDN